MNTVEAIAALIEGYHRIPADFQDIPRLMNLRRLLATRCFELAIEAGRAKSDANAAEFARRAKYATAYTDAIKSGESDAKSRLIADAESMDLRRVEMDNDATIYSLRLILEGANNVLDTLNQHISNLKKEQTLEFSGQGRKFRLTGAFPLLTA